MSETELSTVHHAMSEAVQAPAEDEGPMGNYSFRIHSAIRSKAEEICRTNGTSFPEWLRKCCEVLIKDYVP